MFTSAIPNQEQCNPGKPDEHFLWALRAMPMIAGSGMMTHPGFLRGWSKHLWECGFAHRDYLAGLADADGNIHVSKLPAQQIEFQPPFRGPQHGYNPASQWVKPGTAAPQPVTIPDINEWATNEQYVLAYQLKECGVVIPDAVKPSTAQVINEEPPA